MRERADGRESGRLQYRVRALRPGRDREDDHHDRRGPVDRFVSTAITSVTFSDDPSVRPARRPQPTIDAVVFSGTGRWNGTPGYTFTARAVDAGEPGRGRDHFTITIMNPAGAIVSTVTGALTGGNIQSHRVR